MSTSTILNTIEDKKEAVKTYIEQTKLLVTLSSAFIIPPAVMYVTVKGFSLQLLVITEVLFVISTVLGYIVLGTIAGSQDKGEYNVYRQATRVFSLLEFLFYLLGLTMFVIFISKYSGDNNNKTKELESTTFNIKSQKVTISVGDTLPISK